MRSGSIFTACGGFGDEYEAGEQPETNSSTAFVKRTCRRHNSKLVPPPGLGSYCLRMAVVAIGIYFGTRAFLMVYNRSATERSPLNLAITDDGVHWRDFFQLEGGVGEYSYPAMIEARNGDLLITYTWRREKIRFVRFPRNQIGTGALRGRK
jgi:BNR repeat-like domain